MDEHTAPVARVRLLRLWHQLWRFGLSGLAGLATDVALLYLTLALGAGYGVGRALSFLAAVWVTWQVNRRFAFRDVAERATWRQWWHYLLAMSGGGALNLAAFTVAVLLLPDDPMTPMFAVVIGSLCSMSANFVSAKYVVTRRVR